MLVQPGVTRTLRLVAPALALVLASYAVPGSASAAVAPSATLAASLGGSPAADGTGVSGWTKARDGVLRKGCHRYSYRYRVQVPTESWSLEVQVLDPSRDGVAFHTLFAETDPAKGRKRFTLCRASTEPGRFLIKAKVVTLDGWTTGTTTLPRTTFRLRRP